MQSSSVTEKLSIEALMLDWKMSVCSNAEQEFECQGMSKSRLSGSFGLLRFQRKERKNYFSIASSKFLIDTMAGRASFVSFLLLFSLANIAERRVRPCVCVCV